MEVCLPLCLHVILQKLLYATASPGSALPKAHSHGYGTGIGLLTARCSLLLAQSRVRRLAVFLVIPTETLNWDGLPCGGSSLEGMVYTPRKGVPRVLLRTGKCIKHKKQNGGCLARFKSLNIALKKLNLKLYMTYARSIYMTVPLSAAKKILLFIVFGQLLLRATNSHSTRSSFHKIVQHFSYATFVYLALATLQKLRQLNVPKCLLGTPAHKRQNP